VLGAGGFFAYREGLIFRPSDTTATARADSIGADTAARADSLLAADTARPGGTGSAGGGGGGISDTTRTPITARVPPPAPGTPGRLTLRGVPLGSRVIVDGQQMRGTELDLPPGLHRLVIRAAGYQTLDRQVAIIAGETLTIGVDLQPVQREGDTRLGPCDQFGPAYNQDNLCFDTRPVPLSPTLIPVAGDAPIFPRQAILLIKVSRTGTTLEARVYAPSNVATFNNEALDMARTLRWNPAQKNGEPVEAWVQWPFQPVRQ
jgi:TonB family protein